MSPSIEENPTPSQNGTTEQSPQSNHHASPDPSPSSEVRGKRVPARRASVDKDAQDLVISSLRTQVQDLVSQVTELNNKLVKSYDRVSDLEDDLHVTSSSLRSSSVKISQLELERSQHLSALNTGLLVEKSHVTSELTRLMEKATEEAARRGQAESARAAIEKDLDDVSAALFDQANTMVAEARLGRAQSDRKADEAERALREAEDAVRLMQQELQALQGEKESAERRMESMSTAMGKGRLIERASSLPANACRLLTSHISYQEFLSLISHLRGLRHTYPHPPTITSLLGLPFIARLHVEDTDPTVRLDTAASLNWLSRRSIMAAIQSGQLAIEPIATQTILASSTSPQPPLAVNVIHGSNNANLLSCGLCGHGIVPHTEPSPSRTGYLSRANHTQFNSWSSSIFRKPSSTPTHSEPPSPPPYHDISSLPAQLYVFRLSDPSPAFPSALPLCTSGWCLARLRAACSLWSFLRTSILEKIWEEEVRALLPPPRREVESAMVERPPVPPRRKAKNSGFWGVASSFGLDRVPGWGESDKDKDKRVEPETEKRRFVAPPLRSNSPGPGLLTPPPLPTRNRSRPQVSPTLSSLLVSSSEDADPPTEGFLTPEDLAPTETACVFLPPQSSSHNTPLATSGPLPDDTKTIPAESAARVSVASDKEVYTAEHVEEPSQPPVVTTIRPVSLPSRTGSPTAPPLPRRAAARRTVPPPPRPVPPALSAPVAAAVAAADVSPTSVTVPVSPPKTKEAEGAAFPAAETTESVASAISKAEAEIVDVSGAAAELDADQFDEGQQLSLSTDGSAAPPDNAAVEDSPEGGARADTNTGTSADDAYVEPETVRQERRAMAEEKAAARARHPPPPPRHPHPVRAVEREALSDLPSLSRGASGADSPRKSKLDGFEEPMFAPDGTPYVSDGTWEERTWKELTRLREDMFWARLGSIR
ncbi:proline-rich protein [Russula earlei]|uniref:Proline-rich protein n=1 Tax=Russula earlei TaxID=71964 RepID=A0ACC0UGX4_9AGAM|nr:proline-rich protein [Russula earlei]